MSDTFSQADVEVVEREECFRGFYKLDRLHLRHRLFAGGMGKLINRELFVRHDAVCVLPYDPQRDEVVLIEQFRVGAIDKAANPWLLELVAGLIDKDAELARLDKEIQRLQGEVQRVGGKLANEGFVAKAPAEVLDKERAKLAEAEQALAKLMHLALYALMIGTPLLGWLILSAFGKPIPFFGLELPALIAPDHDFGEQLEHWHVRLADAGYWLIGLHAVAGLFHHYISRDNTLTRMLPGRN